MANAASIIAGLGGDNKGMCRCPAHDDKRPSLHVSEGSGGKVLVKCHAGCSQEAVIEALKGLGLWDGGSQRTARFKYQRKRETEEKEMARFDRAFSILRAAAYAEHVPRDYFRHRGIKRAPETARLLPARDVARLTGRRCPAAVLAITDGNILRGAQLTFLTNDAKENALDREGKSCRRTYGTVKGGYIAFGVDEPDKPLIVAEGVETALSGAQLTGYPAIAALSAGNMKEIALPACAEVIICGDNDKNGTGEREAKSAAARWCSTNRKVRIAIPPNHKDWNEALCDSNTDPAVLRRAIVHAPEYEPATITSVGMQAFMDLTFPQRTYLLKPWLTTTSLTMIDALPGHGKTWLALSVAYAVATGKPLMGWTCERSAPVLYVDGELPGATLQDRIRLLGGLVPDTNLRLLSHAQFAARGEMMIDLGTEAGRAALDTEIEAHQIELIILDSVTTLVRSGEDNDIASWRAVQDWSLKHRSRGRAVIFLHHHGRSGNPRGTSAREIVLDARLKLTRDVEASNETESAFKIEFVKAREFYGEDAAPTIAFLSTAEGVASWRRETVKASNRERVKELNAAGWTATEIAKEVQLTKGRVSQILKDEGLKTTSPKKTFSGVV